MSQLIYCSQRSFSAYRSKMGPIPNAKKYLFFPPIAQLENVEKLKLRNQNKHN